MSLELKAEHILLVQPWSYQDLEELNSNYYKEIKKRIKVSRNIQSYSIAGMADFYNLPVELYKTLESENQPLLFPVLFHIIRIGNINAEWLLMGRGDIFTKTTNKELLDPSMVLYGINQQLVLREIRSQEKDKKNRFRFDRYE